MNLLSRPAHPVTMSQREQAELERGAAEALDIDASAWQKSDILRYLDPPGDTPYALEYSFHLLGDVTGKTVLELGCGAGEDTLLLARRAATVYAMDISAPLVRLAGHRLGANGARSHVRFLVGSAHTIPLADETVDVVFGVAVLHHLDLSVAAREVARVLRRGGRAIFEEPVRNSNFVRFVRNLIPYRPAHLSPFERPLTDEELRRFAAPFTNYRSRSFELVVLTLARFAPGVRRYWQRLCRWDRAALDRFPALGHYAAIRVIELVK